MADPFSPAERSAIMAKVPATGSGPEMKVRRAVHRAGFRYRLHGADLPGKPDLVFPRHRLAVFVHGCFWHWHGCKRSRMPEANNDYWTGKIGRNVERDKRNLAALREQGWESRILWECELTEGIETLIAELRTKSLSASAANALSPSQQSGSLPVLSSTDDPRRGIDREQLNRSTS